MNFAPLSVQCSAAGMQKEKDVSLKENLMEMCYIYDHPACPLAQLWPVTMSLLPQRPDLLPGAAQANTTQHCTNCMCATKMHKDNMF